MTAEKLIEEAYSAFSNFKRPFQCTKYSDFEDAEFNSGLLSVKRRGLSIEQAGTVAWGPIPSMTSEALAYFMPRLIELAVSGAVDRDGFSFYCFFVNTFYNPAGDERFRIFKSQQRDVIAETFHFLCETYRDQLDMEGWLEEARQGIDNWGGIR